MENQLKKAIEISRKTGDRLIVFDSAKSDQTFVVMSLNEYEKLVVGRSEVRGLTEDELLDKINRDIAIWKSEQIVDNEPDTKLKEPVVDISDFKDFYDDEEDDYYQEDIPSFAEIERKLHDNPSTPRSDLGPTGQGKKSKRSWMIPTHRKEAADEVIEEDRQYLERV